MFFGGMAHQIGTPKIINECRLTIGISERSGAMNLFIPAEIYTRENES